MDFRQATDDLCNAVSHEQLARALGVSVATVRQARLSETANAFRSPPAGWQQTVIQLAREQISRHQRLIETLEKDDILPSHRNRLRLAN